MKQLTAAEYREIIRGTLPDGTVLQDHDANGHFYKIPRIGVRYPSVSGRIHIFREEGLNDWRMNKALEYVLMNFQKFTNHNIQEHLTHAEQQSVVEFRDAGDIGTDIHSYREEIFKNFITQGSFPPKFESVIPVGREDIRAISAMGALQKFVVDYHYEPIATEMYVYSERMHIAGTLDDIGLIWIEVRKGDPDCQHEMVGTHCVKCNLKYKKELCLMDLKSSNQLKSIYWIQVALYYTMFKSLTGLNPKKVFILKLDKHNRTYTVEFLKDIPRTVRIAKKVLSLANDLDWIKEARKREVEYI